jgi:hypothetical protein
MRCIILSLVLLATGCGSSHELGDEWLPLEQITESKIVGLGLSTGGAVTLGNTIFVVDLEKWFERNPEPKLTAILLHEQIHAARQLKMGLSKWLAKYLTDTEFMLYEEQLGWYAKIKHYGSVGYRWDPKAFARSLHRVYNNTNGPMISEEDALKWLLDVRAGRWQPKEE